jgi:hypothetical protein
MKRGGDKEEKELCEIKTLAKIGSAIKKKEEQKESRDASELMKKQNFRKIERKQTMEKAKAIRRL